MTDEIEDKKGVSDIFNGEITLGRDRMISRLKPKS